MQITKVLEDFIKCWAVYNGQESLDRSEIVKRINNGDCGLTAIAVHYVLLNRFQIATHILSNRNHCWLRLENDDYDTKEPTGYHPDRPANHVWSNEGFPDDVHEDTFADTCNEWMPCDAHGGYFVKAFVERYNLEMPEALQHCVDKAAEYERPEEVPVLEAKYQLVKDLLI